MYKAYFLIIFLLCFFSCSNEDSKSSFLLDSENEESINSLINDMSIEEKVGQTCQITLDAILKKDSLGVLLEPHQIDQEKLDKAILEFKQVIQMYPKDPRKLNYNQVKLLSQAHHNLSIAYAKKEWYIDAEKEAYIAFELIPSSENRRVLDLIKEKY